MGMMFFADREERVQVGVRFFGGAARGRTFRFVRPMAEMEGFSEFFNEVGQRFDRNEFTAVVRESQTVEMR